MAKHPIGFKPSFPKLITLSGESWRRKEPEEDKKGTTDAVAGTTLYDSDEMPYEDKAKEAGVYAGN